METMVSPNESKTTKELIQETLPKAFSYQEYRDLVQNLVIESKATGPQQSEALANYTALNDRRMKRLDKTVKIDVESANRFKEIDKNMTFLVLTESWCGDAAQTMPVMNKIAELHSTIEMKVVLRDENLALMNRFLYNGTLSIPKLIVIDDVTGEVIGDWGPRPSELTKMVEDYKAEHGKLTPEFKKELQIWYNKDKGKGTIKDLARLLLK